MFVHISSSWVEICLHTKFQLPGLRRGRLFTWFTWFYRLHPHCYICICYIHLITILHPCIFASLHPCKLTLTWLDSIDCMHLIWPAKSNICIILKCFLIWWFWDMFLGIQDPSFLARLHFIAYKLLVLFTWLQYWIFAQLHTSSLIFFWGFFFNVLDGPRD